VPTAFRIMVLLALLGWLAASLRIIDKRWRLPLAFVVLAGALGPGLVVNHGFKDNWQRARPYQVQQFGGTQQFTRAAVMTDQCDNNCSFVSGHVACGFFIASLMLVHRRRQAIWGTLGIASGLTIGFARMADGAHWLSDVLWACPITLFCSWAVWSVLLRLYSRPTGP
jgi:lipid A 4'-phosphatase